jgi:hypothetical protein
MSPFQERVWYTIKPEAWVAVPALHSNVTHAMWLHGQTLLKLVPYTTYAIARTDDGQPYDLPGTAHRVTIISVVGKMSTSYHEGWSSADGSRSLPADSETESLAWLEKFCLSEKERRATRTVISRKAFAMMIDVLAPTPWSDDNVLPNP